MTDLLIQLGIGATFVIFAICLWLLKKEKEKRRDEKKPGAAASKDPRGLT